MNEQFQATPDPSKYQHFHLRKEEEIRLSYIYPEFRKEAEGGGSLRKGNFTLDIWGEEEDGSYITVEGWTTGELWNGWSVPFFKFKEIMQVLKLCKKCNLGHWFDRFEEDGIKSFEFIENVGRQDEFVADEDGSYILAPDEEGFYNLGARRWTWEEIARPIDEPNKIIEITEYLCEPETMKLEDFITAQTLDGFGNPLTPEQQLVSNSQIEQLENLDVDESMPFGESEAGLTIKRIK